MKKVGAITIGQAPRNDVTCDIMHLFGDIELLQAGGLDGLAKEEIAKFVPDRPDDYVLVSKLKDGSQVLFAERYILPRLQACIDKLEAQGVSLIMFFCTGEFPHEFRANVPLIFPCRILNGVVPVLTHSSKIIVITPDEKQVEQSQKKWRDHVDKVTSIPASPYGEADALQAAARQAREVDGDLVVMDCIGYTQEMKRMFAEETGKNIVLSRTILARVVSEILDEGGC